MDCIALSATAIMATGTAIHQWRNHRHARARIEGLERRNRELWAAMVNASAEAERQRKISERLRRRPPVRLPNLTWSTICRN